MQHSVEVGLTREPFDEAAMKARPSSIGGDPIAKPSLWLPTRLADGTVTVAVTNLVSPFTGQEINALPIPGRWLRGVVLPDEPINVVNGRLRIGTQDYAYNRLGIQRLRATQ